MGLAGYGIKSIWPIFKTKKLIYQSQATLDEKILLGKITYHPDPEFTKRRICGNKNSTFHSSP